MRNDETGMHAQKMQGGCQGQQSGLTSEEFQYYNTSAVNCCIALSLVHFQPMGTGYNNHNNINLNNRRLMDHAGNSTFVS